MQIERHVSNLMISNMYIIHEGTHAIVIDPFDGACLANHMIVDKIILTHEHYDHISGVNTWKEKTHAPVLCSKACSENISSNRKNFARHFKDFCEIQTWMKIDKIPEFDPDYECRADETFEDSFRFKWMGHELYLFEIPGHSQGSIGILVDDKFFFSGDSLMQGIETEVRLPGGSRKKWESVGKPRVETLKKGITVYPGHLNEFVLE